MSARKVHSAQGKGPRAHPAQGLINTVRATMQRPCPAQCSLCPTHLSLNFPCTFSNTSHVNGKMLYVTLLLPAFLAQHCISVISHMDTKSSNSFISCSIYSMCYHIHLFK